MKHNTFMSQLTSAYEQLYLYSHIYLYCMYFQRPDILNAEMESYYLKMRDAIVNTIVIMGIILTNKTVVSLRLVHRPHISSHHSPYCFFLLSHVFILFHTMKVKRKIFFGVRQLTRQSISYSIVTVLHFVIKCIIAYSVTKMNQFYIKYCLSIIKFLEIYVSIILKHLMPYTLILQISLSYHS